MPHVKMTTCTFVLDETFSLNLKQVVCLNLVLYTMSFSDFFFFSFFFVSFLLFFIFIKYKLKYNTAKENL